MRNVTLAILVVLISALASSKDVEAIELDKAFVADEIPLGFGGEGATWDGNSLWVIHESAALIKRYSTQSKTLVGQIPLIGPIGEGLAWDGTSLWTSSGIDLFEVDPSDGTILSVIDVQGGVRSSGGLTFDGTNFWKIIRPNFHAIDASGSFVDIITEFDLPGVEEGLTFDGTYLYVISYNDATDPRIWKIDPVTHTLMPDSFALPNGLYNGLAFDGDSLWAVSWSGQTVYKISPAPTVEKNLVSGPLSDDGTGALLPFDVNNDGTVDVDDEGKLIGIGLSHAQYYVLEIKVTNEGASNSLDNFAFLDVLPPDFRLSGFAEDALASCAGNACDGVDVSGDCVATISGPRAKKNSVVPRYVTIEPDQLAAAAACTTTVYVETAGGDSGKGKNAGTFEPKACEIAETADDTVTNTIALNDGVKTFDVTTNTFLAGPFGSIQLSPHGC